MARIQIREPIWKSKSIGIAEHKLKHLSTTEIEILYRNQHGHRLWPDVYCITRAQAMQYPVQMLYGIRLRIIPIADLEVLSGKAKQGELF